jgi:putative cell wall-binding protein
MQLRKQHILLFSFTVLFSVGVFGQSQNVSKRTSAKLDLVVVRSPQTLITLRAENIRLQQIATRLAEQLNVPVGRRLRWKLF